MDAIGTKLMRQPALGDAFAGLGFGPRAIGLVFEVLDQSAAEGATLLGEEKMAKDIYQECADGIVVFRGGAEGDGCLAGDARPVFAGQVRENEQGFPDVGGTVVQGCGDVRLGGGDGVGEVESEPSALASEVGSIKAG
jgi:hypothetical protein